MGSNLRRTSVAPEGTPMQAMDLGPSSEGLDGVHQAIAEERRQLALVLKAAQEGEGGTRVGAAPLVLRAAQDGGGDHAVHASAAHLRKGSGPSEYPQ